MRITANVNTQFYVTGSPRTPTPVINNNYQKLILDSHLMWVSRQRPWHDSRSWRVASPYQAEGFHLKSSTWLARRTGFLGNPPFYIWHFFSTYSIE